MAFTLLTLNTEGNLHFTRMLPFLEQQNADVICLQEVFREDLEIIEAVTGMPGTYIPQANIAVENPYIPVRGEWGVFALTKLPVISAETFTYVGDPDALPIFFEHPNPADLKTTNNSMNRVAVALTIREQTGKESTIVTTHFTWSPKGSSTSEQAADAHALRTHLAKLPPHILCGDMNSPRGEATFDLLSAGYTDALPPEITGTLDPVYHPVGHLPLVVDALLAHPGYVVTNVQMHTGVSDHCAFTARVERL